MTDAPCRHEWETVATNEHGTALYCGKCAVYRFDFSSLPKVPDGDLYYLEET